MGWESESEEQDPEVQGIQDWGGYPSETGDIVHNALSYLHNAYHALKGKSKGKGKSQFNGECHYCGKWGHTARECKLKDSHMEQYRQNTQAASIEPESPEYDGACDHDDNRVSALETLGGHRNMGHWELSHVSTSIVPNQVKKTQKSHEQIVDGLVAKNPFI